MAEGSEKHEFQAEVNRLMDIIINSLYTDKQVFLRELISNAADALEKARFHSVQDETFLGDTKDLEVKIEHDPDAKTISIIDTGVGMSKADLINNLGTVAKSGTTNFLEAMAEGGDANLIGQFGVGFYSAFLVADKVSVTSKCNDDPVQHVWESSADASFTVVDDPRGNTLGRGTRVTLHLKEDAHDYLSEDKLKESAKKYSQFIQFPIYVKVKKEVDAEAEEDDDDDDKDDEEEKDDVETKDEEEKEEEDKKPKKKTVFEWEQVNTQKAIWLRAKEDVTEEEYNEFYKSISKDYLDPLAYTHFNAEGEIEFKSILFLPKKAPFDMMDNYWTKKSEVKLFVRRVLVAEKFDELLPRYLNFVRGVVDSDDLPLNVSREQLQQNKIMKVISKKLVRKVLELMKKLAKDEESGGDDEDEEKEDEEKEEKEEKKEKKDEEGLWSKFWKEFNKNLKMGCYEDDSNRSKLSKLLRFFTTKSEGKEVSLDKYLDRMQESQESIYYMSGESLETMKKAPALQIFLKKDLEVLMLPDHLDEPCLQKLADYEGKKFVSIQKADVKLDETEEEKKKFNKIKDMYKPLTDWWKKKLTDLTESGAMKEAGVKVEKVEVSKRLTESPVVVVTSQFGYSAQQEKVMKSQAFQNKEQLSMMAGRKTLEVNPNHPVIVDLLAKVKASEGDEAAAKTAEVLFQTALIESGFEIADPSALVSHVYRLMSKELGVNPDAPLKEIEVPEEEEEAEEEDKEDDDSEEDSKEEKEVVQETTHPYGRTSCVAVSAKLTCSLHMQGKEFRADFLFFLLLRAWFVGLAAVALCGQEDADKVVDGFSDTDRAKMAEGSEKHEFQAEVNRLMDIIINSLYTDKQVFLRELISNAADALEKARFHSVQDETFLGDTKDLEVKIEHDPDAKTISIIDTGVGMSKADLINNLGTVAKSGTTNFLEAMAEGGDANLIGQFGVGFYSAFLVADKVSVTSKCNDDPVQHVWESSADASFTVVDDPRGNTLGRGTRVTLHLKEDAHDYLSEDKLKESAKKYSQFIQFPIYVKVKKEVDAEAEEDDDDDDKDDEEEKDDVETKDEEEKEEEDKKPKKKTVFEWEQVNTQKAIWLRAKEDVTEEEYNEFYKSISKDYLDPLAYTHFNAEGEIEFKSILFLPKKAPFDMMDNYWTKKSEVKLFVRRVLVAEKFDELLPRYLNFVRGVVDSDDLPLNVSREQLQQNKIMKVISKKLVRKVLELMKKLAKDEESGGDDEDEEKEDEEKEEKEEKKEKKDEEGLWSKFWKEFNKNLKMGCYEDDSNRSKLSKLLRFFTTKSEGKEVSLDKYLDRMQESQESIYYMSGESLETMKKAPALQIFLKKDLEVLMLPDHLDEPCLQKLADYEGKKFVSIQKADVKLDETEEEKKKFNKIKDMYKPLTDWWKKKLTDLTESGAMKEAGVKVEKVEVSKRLTESPVVVVTSQFGYSAQQEKVMKSQAFQNKEQLSMMAGRKTLEVNPNHPVIVDLLAKVKASEGDEAAAKTAEVLFQTALIESGFEIADPSALVSHVYRLMSKELGVNPDAPLKEIEVPEEEEEAEEEDKEDDDSEEDSKEEKEAMRCLWRLAVIAVGIGCAGHLFLKGNIRLTRAEEDADKVVDGFSDTDRAKMAEGSEKHEFQAEVNRLMDIIINSLYTDKQVFLRELISNAADALEKARFHSVQDETFLGDTKDLEVKIEHDPDAKTISIIDTGVGMSKADLINNLGTVAKSGTTNFLEAMAEGGDANLIGQFGVGFYSAFLVADKVSVTSKCNDDPVQHVWESSADASFTVVDDPRGNTLGRGTRVTLHLKEDAHDYLSEDKLKESAKKYSQFIQFPIYVKVKKEVDAEAEEEDDDDDKDDEEEKDDVETKDEEEKEEEDKKPKKKTVFEWEQVNTQKAIWLRAKEDVTEEEYNEFYKSISKDYLDPLAYTHFNAEGEIEFKSILFLPKKAPFDMMDNYWTKKSEVKLFVRRVLVAEKFDELLPRYLNFVRGVVDSDDLPLNVSREQLQQNKIMKVISKKLVRKVLELMKKLAKDEESGGDDEDEEKEDEEKEEKEEKKEKKDEEGLWSKFWKEFNKNLKMGCYEDDSNRSKLSKLLRFFTTKSEGKEVSLDKYLDRMQESQESIYYMSGESLETMKKAPALQIFLKKDLEVLMLPDHLDEPCLQKLADYEGKKFVSIQKADVKLDETEEEKKKFNKIKDMYKPLTDWWKKKLTDLTESGAMKEAGVKVEKVEVSKRLTESPVVVVTSQFGYSAQQEKVMKSQAFQNKEQLSMMAGRKTLEVNPNHPVIVDLLAKVKASEGDEAAAKTAEVLFQTALIESGFEIADPSALVSHVYRLMSKELGVNPDAPLKEIEVPEDEEEAEEEDKEDDDSEEDSKEEKEDL
ncbi:unnamed protein product [Symbiodinium natans]|uniref:Histidine kinase/HSP90-like ATPase domain-containing protein n=1 Tax=Symbiodinium natans TaxID=878477 RepID=A0A812IH42_9DINO|nr:unnamed protein product [Symbiodinium natans]